ncbi:MAG: DNA-binding protein, partial [Bacteroidetes bacterium CG_4_9_14_3_um_filter_41_19]
MGKAEIIIYKESDSDFQIEVRLEDETVWLNRQQLSDLFNRDIKTIGKHINNALREELESIPVIAKFATTASDGKTYQVEHYNLDMILSVGYRVKSQRGILFRRWANNVLKEYLLKGHVYNHRFEKIEKKLFEHDQKFELIINTGLKPTEGIFYDGQIFDAWQFASDLIKDAEQSIILIDNYIDESVFNLLTKRKTGVSAKVFTGKITKQLEADLL